MNPLPLRMPLPLAAQHQHQQLYRTSTLHLCLIPHLLCSALLPLSDEAIVQRVRKHLEACEPGFKGEKATGRTRVAYAESRLCKHAQA